MPLLNLDVDIKYIWGMKWGISKCFYIATKYLAFCDGILTLYYLFNTNLRPSTCDILYPVIICSPKIILLALAIVVISVLFLAVFVVFGVVMAEIIISIRTWIAWGLSRYILWYLTFMVVATTSFALFLIQAHSEGVSPWRTHHPSPIPTIRNCLRSRNDLYAREQYLSFVCIIVLELSVFIFPHLYAPYC